MLTIPLRRKNSSDALPGDYCFEITLEEIV
jgi:hypothetical protein